jgi:hypothetical protein
MENKQLQLTKDTIAKKYGYENFEQFDDKSTFGYNHDTPKIIDEVAIEYHRLMSECDAEEEKEEEPILIGYLNKEFGYQNHLPIQIGTEVFLHKDRYFFYTTTLSGLRQMVQFYKETLHNAIDFI